MICVDASVAIKWILVEEYSEAALDLSATAVEAGEAIVAPQLLLFEVTNVLRQRMRRRGLTLSEARYLLSVFLRRPMSLRSPPGLHEQALAIADTYGLPAAYDAHYVGLAQMLGCDFWTDDRRLLRALAGRLPFVRWIGDFSG